VPQSAWIHVSTLGAFYHLTAECIRLKPAASNWLNLGLLSAAKIVQRIYSFSQCVAIFAEITEGECVKERRPCRIRTFDWYQKSVTLNGVMTADVWYLRGSRASCNETYHIVQMTVTFWRSYAQRSRSQTDFPAEAYTDSWFAISCNSQKHCLIVVIFGKNITEKASNQKMLYF